MSRDGRNRRAGRSVQSVDRAVAVVERLAASRAGLSLTELAGGLALAPQTAQSLLRTLQYHGWVTQGSPRGRYRLGPALGEIVRRWHAGQDRAVPAEPVVTDLGRRLGEYVILAEWAGGGLVPLLEVRADRELSVRGEAYRPERLHTMATGKLLLAMLDERRRREIVASLPLQRRGPNSVTDPAALLEQLDATARDGVAVCVEEAAAGVVALAVPVAGRAPAALGTALPLARYVPARRDELLDELQRAARAIASAWA